MNKTKLCRKCGELREVVNLDKNQICSQCKNKKGWRNEMYVRKKESN